MKYELQTIPVWKAIEAKPACLLCHLEQESEQRNVTFFLGNAIMAPEMRVKLNDRGFCRRHFHMLGQGSGKLGYSLALRTHLDSLQERLSTLSSRVQNTRGKARSRAVEALAAFLRAQEGECLMCERMKYNVANYAYTVVKLFSEQQEFRTAVGASNGFCLHHLPMVLEMGEELLRGSEGEAWYQELFALEFSNLDRERENLEEFTWQFDYQLDKKTPEHAQDAIPRALQRLAGYGPR